MAEMALFLLRKSQDRKQEDSRIYDWLGDSNMICVYLFYVFLSYVSLRYFVPKALTVERNLNLLVRVYMFYLELMHSRDLPDKKTIAQ